MSSTTILPDQNGRRYAFRSGQLIVCGKSALAELQVELEHNYGIDESSYTVYENGDVNEWRAGQGLENTYLIHGLPDTEFVLAVILEVATRFREVQLNHVHFAHSLTETGIDGVDQLAGLEPDECCDGDAESDSSDATASNATPYNLNPWTVNAELAPWTVNPTLEGATNPLTLSPWTVNPWTVNPWTVNAAARTSARPAADPSSGGREHGNGEGVDVWILDSGLGDFAGGPPSAPSPDPEAPRRPVMPIAGDYRNTWLEGQQVQGDYWDRPDLRPVFGDGYVDPFAGHGTFIAGVFAQLVPGAELTVRSVLGPAGDVSEWTVADVLGQLLSTRDPRRPVVVNLSFGAYHGQVDHCIKQLLDHMDRIGVAVVASAGNDGSCRPTYPAAYDSVVGVGAVGSAGKASFSNYGSWVDTWAPGVEQVSTFLPWNGAISRPFTIDEEVARRIRRPLGRGPRDPIEQPLASLDDDDFTAGWATWSGTSFAASVVGAAMVHHLGTGLSVAEAKELVTTREERQLCKITQINLPW